jgi:hypothetical protein
LLDVVWVTTEKILMKHDPTSDIEQHPPSK